MAGMVLNDVFDVETDRQRAARAAVALGPDFARRGPLARLGVVVLGVACGGAAAVFAGDLRPGIVAAILAGMHRALRRLAEADAAGAAGDGRVPMLNVLLGMSAAAVPWATEHWLVAGGIGVYIAGVTWFARTRSRAQQPRPPGLGHWSSCSRASAMLAWFPSFARSSPDPVAAAAMASG